MTASRALLKSAVGAARFRLTGRRAPLAVSLCVTRRCDAMCAYCSTPSTPCEELGADEILGLIDLLADRGATRLNFVGGEPLQRRELPDFVRRCRDHGLWTVVETNGHALPERVDELPASRFMVSLDGSEPVHDRLREPGSFRRAVAGIRAARAAGRTVGTVTVLTRHNLDDVPLVLAMGRELGFDATFSVLDVHASKAARRARPDPNALRRSFRWLLEARAEGQPVAMSEKCLRYLLEWPDYDAFRAPSSHEDLTCMAGQVSCAIDADGGVYACVPRLGENPVGNVRTDGFDAAFARLRDNDCRACASTACTESSFLYNLNKPAMIEVARVSARRVVPLALAGAPR